MAKKKDKTYSNEDIEHIVLISEYNAIEDMKKDFNSMPLWDRIWLAIKGYEL